MFILKTHKLRNVTQLNKNSIQSQIIFIFYLALNLDIKIPLSI